MGKIYRDEDQQASRSRPQGCKVECGPRHLDIRIEGGPLVWVTAVDPFIVRIQMTFKERFARPRSWSGVRSHVDETFEPYWTSVTDHLAELKTHQLSVSVVLRDGKVRIATADGISLCEDSVPVQANPSGLVARKTLPESTRFYGFGQRNGPLERRGRVMTNWCTDPSIGQTEDSDPLYISIPACMGLADDRKPFAIYLNSTWRSTFDIGAMNPNYWSMETAGDELDYFVICAATPSAVSQRLCRLIGKPAMPPLWALGYHHSRWGYKSEAEILSVARELRQRQIPCDAIHLDIDYMDGYRVFHWDHDRFPDPGATVRTLHDLKFRVVAIVDPGVKAEPGNPLYEQGSSEGHFIRKSDGELFTGYAWPDEVAFPDFLRPQTCEWWECQVEKFVVESGVDGIWNDMNEPTVFERPFSEGLSEPARIGLDALQGPDGERASHREVHNLYGHEMARVTYKSLALTSQARPFVLTRSAFAGTQCYAACWMGDNNSTWEHLRQSVPQLLNMGLSGMPFAGVDIGGFAGDTTPELLARWTQLGALLPFCRNHNHTESIPQEPWAFGPEVETVCRDALSLRYRLLPYLYTLFAEAARFGTPVMRPLFYHYPDDSTTHVLEDQFMVGESLLVAPVLDSGARSRTLYLPMGQWHDLETGELLVGGAWHHVPVSLSSIPRFARAGAILPSVPAAQFSEEVRSGPLFIDIYPGNGELHFWDDDGYTRAYLRGKYALSHFLLKQSDRNLTLKVEGHCPRGYRPLPRDISLRLHSPGARFVTGETVSAETTPFGLLLRLGSDIHLNRELQFEIAA